MILYCMVLLIRYVYSRLKWLGNKVLSLAITMLFLSLWHGLWPGYYVCFVYEMMYIMVERTVRFGLKKLLAVSCTFFLLHFPEYYFPKRAVRLQFLVGDPLTVTLAFHIAHVRL